VVQPWDKNSISSIEKSIQKSELGLNPINDGRVIRITIPSLNEERRQELLKLSTNASKKGKLPSATTARCPRKTENSGEKQRNFSRRA